MNEILRQFINFTLAKGFLTLIKSSTMPQMLKSKKFLAFYCQAGCSQEEKYIDKFI